MLKLRAARTRLGFYARPRSPPARSVAPRLPAAKGTRAGTRRLRAATADAGWPRRLRRLERDLGPLFERRAQAGRTRRVCLCHPGCTMPEERSDLCKATLRKEGSRRRRQEGAWHVPRGRGQQRRPHPQTSWREVDKMSATGERRSMRGASGSAWRLAAVVLALVALGVTASERRQRNIPRRRIAIKEQLR